MKKNAVAGGMIAVLFGAALIAVFLFYSSPAPAKSPSRVSWDPPQLATQSMAPGESASYTVVLKNSGAKKIKAKKGLRIVAEGDIAPFVTISQPTFPKKLLSGDEVTVEVTVSIPADAPVSVKTGELVLEHVKKKNKVKYAWRADALPVTVEILEKLAHPSDPQIIEYGVEPDTFPVLTKVYEGKIELPPDTPLDISTLQVRSGISETSVIAGDGRFTARMNVEATALLRVLDSNGNAILLQLFPKADSLVKVNPIINATSTAVALVALQPGIITSDPLLDVLILAIIEKLPETQMLSEQIATEIAQGSFRLNSDFSPEIQSAIQLVLQRLASLSVDDVIASSFLDKLVRYASQAALALITSAHAAPALVADCNDNFTDTFTGAPGTKDDVCIAAALAEPGAVSNFNIWNRRTRWVFLAP